MIVWGTMLSESESLRFLQAGVAGVIRNPEGDNPFVHPEQTIQRRAEVLKGMVSQHYITQAQADAGNQEQMPTVKPTSELRPDNAWAEKAQEVLLSDPRLGATPRPTGASSRAKSRTGSRRSWATSACGCSSAASPASAASASRPS